MKWSPFRCEQDTYDLSHLHPKIIKYVQEAKGDKPARIYTVEIHFSLHCFTHACQPGEPQEGPLCYRDDRETRVFDFGRYALSHRLPEIAEGLMERKCYHTGRENFFTVEIINGRPGSQIEYEIYFAASRASRKGIVNLFVQSAYVRDKQHLGNRPQLKAIRFHVILFNVLNRIPIKTQKF